jgi:hypothetical protein
MVACSAQKEPPPRWWVFRGEGEESAIAADPERDCDESELEEMVTPKETKGGWYRSSLRSQPVREGPSTRQPSRTSIENTLPSRVGSVRTSSERRPKLNPREKPSDLRPLPSQGNAGWCHASVEAWIMRNRQPVFPVRSSIRTLVSCNPSSCRNSGTCSKCRFEW